MNTTTNNTTSDAIKRLIISALQENPSNHAAHDLIERYNESHDDQLCDRCGHTMEFGDGYRCAGWYCPNCGHEKDTDNTYY